jgi:hypothetical protein
MADLMLSSEVFAQQQSPFQVDVMASSVRSLDDLHLLADLINKRASKAVIISFPISISGRALLASLSLDTMDPPYTISISSMEHGNFGGATPAA